MIAIISMSSCLKEKCNLKDGQNFLIPGSLEPASDTFSIGDTISFNSSFDENVYDLTTEMEYNLNDFDFYPTTKVKKIDLDSSINGLGDFSVMIDDSFDYSLVYRNLEGLLLEGSYRKINNKYHLSFKLIPNKKGLYLFRHTSSPYRDPNQSSNGACKNRSRRIWGYVEINRGSGNNIEFLQKSPDPHYNHWTLIKPVERFHNGGYCFYVQ